MNSDKRTILHQRRTIRKQTESALWMTALIVAFGALGLSGCRTMEPVPEHTIWTAEFRESANGVTECVLKTPNLARTSLSGTAERSEQGTWNVSIEKIEWFNNWVDGWTEATIVASGSLELTPVTGVNGGEETFQARVITKPTSEYCEKAMIRYRDDILYGDQATALFNRRLERIAVASRYLGTALGGRVFHTVIPEKKKSRDNSFEYLAGSTLFPELYGYPAGTAKAGKEKTGYARGEGLSWDTRYTAQELPAALAEVRNSGTLYRDWEETAELFYFNYIWEN